MGFGVQGSGFRIQGLGFRGACSWPRMFGLAGLAFIARGTFLHRWGGNISQVFSIITASTAPEVPQP